LTDVEVLGSLHSKFEEIKAKVELKLREETASPQSSLESISSLAGKLPPPSSDTSIHDLKKIEKRVLYITNKAVSELIQSATDGSNRRLKLVHEFKTFHMEAEEVKKSISALSSLAKKGALI